jgi:hypothetical protein
MVWDLNARKFLKVAAVILDPILKDKILGTLDGGCGETAFRVGSFRTREGNDLASTQLVSAHVSHECGSRAVTDSQKAGRSVLYQTP